MKKNFIYALMSAIALTGAASFSACSSSDEIVDNPDYNPEKNTVKTQFAISIPIPEGQQTRMAQEDVQGQSTPVFLGMQDVSLIAYSNVLPTSGSTSGITVTKIVLPSQEIPATGGFTATLTNETDGKTNNAKLYSDVEIPIGTKSFMFYAQSKATRAASADYFKSGYITPPTSLTGDPSAAGFVFSLNSTQTEAPSSNSVGTAIASYLTSIIQTTGWSTVAATTALGQLFNGFKTLRAGSSATALAAVQKLYKDLTVDDLGNDIKSKITASGKATADASGNLTFDASLLGYPANINLPDGAAFLTYNETDNSFSVADASAYSSLNVGASSNYVYPASLYYRANSSIRTSTNFESDKYIAANNWAGILNYYNEGIEVTKNTRSVAIIDPIQYAVGRLDLRIKAGASTLKDRIGTDITVPSAGFPVTAVLVGNQKAVGYDFTPKDGAGEKTIYDTAMPTGMVVKGTDFSPINYTLALETAANEHVHVVVELTNNTGAPFQGADGVIPAGGKFYLIAELNPETSSSNATGQANTGNKVFAQDFVTVADLTIDANSTATESNPVKKGLGGAYNIIPDFRTTLFELGMSVNLQWRSGITFTSTI